jgi:hypothetical protein
MLPGCNANLLVFANVTVGYRTQGVVHISQVIPEANNCSLLRDQRVGGSNPLASILPASSITLSLFRAAQDGVEGALTRTICRRSYSGIRIVACSVSLGVEV